MLDAPVLSPVLSPVGSSAWNPTAINRGLTSPPSHCLLDRQTEWIGQGVGFSVLGVAVVGVVGVWSGQNGRRVGKTGVQVGIEAR